MGEILVKRAILWKTWKLPPCKIFSHLQYLSKCTFKIQCNSCRRFTHRVLRHRFIFSPILHPAIRNLHGNAVVIFIGVHDHFVPSPLLEHLAAFVPCDRRFGVARQFAVEDDFVSCLFDGRFLGKFGRCTLGLFTCVCTWYWKVVKTYYLMGTFTLQNTI